MGWLAIISGAVGLCVLGLLLWRLSDIRADDIAWTRLLLQQGVSSSAFDPSEIQHLPEPAQRYFRYTIAPQTALVSAVEIEMDGQLGLGTIHKPAYRSMTAEQVLAPPNGLVWKVRAGAISGSDAATPDSSWTRFWLLHLIPVVRVAGNPDHHRSAFGRVVAEGAFWVPSSLLPSSNATWEAVDQDTARAVVSNGVFSQSVELKVEPDGQPSRVIIQRWSNENPDKTFREQPFGGYLSDFQYVDGYRLPMCVEGGNLIGTEAYFPFYKAKVRKIRFPQLNT